MESGADDIVIEHVSEKLALVPSAHQQETNHFSRLIPRRARLGFAAVALAVGAVGGLAAGIYEAKTTQVQILPGVEADVSPTFGQGAVIEAGPLGSLDLPAVHANAPIIGDISGNINLKKLNLSSTNINELAASIDNPKQLIERPIREKMIDHFEADGLNGLAIGALGALLLIGADSIKQRRRLKETEQELQTISTFTPYVSPWVLELMSSRLTETKDSFHKVTERRKRRLIAATGLSALLVAIPTVYTMQADSKPHISFDAIDPALRKALII